MRPGPIPKMQLRKTRVMSPPPPQRSKNNCGSGPRSGPEEGRSERIHTSTRCLVNGCAACTTEADPQYDLDNFPCWQICRGPGPRPGGLKKHLCWGCSPPLMPCLSTLAIQAKASVGRGGAMQLGTINASTGSKFGRSMFRMQALWLTLVCLLSCWHAHSPAYLLCLSHQLHLTPTYLQTTSAKSLIQWAMHSLAPPTCLLTVSLSSISCSVMHSVLLEILTHTQAPSRAALL